MPPINIILFSITPVKLLNKTISLNGFKLEITWAHMGFLFNNRKCPHTPQFCS